jgi:hypothetical protein
LIVSELNQRRRQHEKNLKIQLCLGHEKGDMRIRSQKRRRSEPEAEVVKTGPSALGFWSIQFFHNR